MPVKKGRVTQKKLFIEVDGEKHFMPKGCDPIIGPQLENYAGMNVEVLLARDTVVAVRPREREPHIWPPFIICYLCPPHKVFDPDIMAEVEPLITEKLVASGYLGKEVVDQLNRWKNVAQ